MVLGWAKTSKSYDQFEQYSKLPTLLKRFSFQEKMRIANHYSSRAIRFNINKTQEPESPMMLPWCVETFVMLSMEATEYAEGDFRGRNEEKAKKMLNAIWDSTAEVLQKQYGNFSLLDVLLPMSALSQFPAQEHLWIKAYRYWTVFNNNAEPLCLRDVFAQKMGTSYEEFLMLGYFLQLMFLAQAEGKNGTIPVKVLEYLLRVRYPKAAKKLVTTRERYVELQRLFIKSNPDSLMYTYSLRPSLQYPLVEEKGVIYFPLPHLFLQSVTSALMFRVTEGNDKMRTKIGAIWEQYVLRLMQDLRDFGVYDEAVGEQPYLHCGSTAYSPDVLVRQGNEMLFLEVKSTVPSVDIRIMQPKAHEENINRIAGYMVQLFIILKGLSAGHNSPTVKRGRFTLISY